MNGYLVVVVCWSALLTRSRTADGRGVDRMNYFIAVIAGYRAAERRNRKAAVASTAALAEMLLCVLTGWAVLLVLLQPVTACYSG